MISQINYKNLLVNTGNECAGLIIAAKEKKYHPTEC